MPELFKMAAFLGGIAYPGWQKEPNADKHLPRVSWPPLTEWRIMGGGKRRLDKTALYGIANRLEFFATPVDSGRSGKSPTLSSMYILPAVLW